MTDAPELAARAQALGKGFKRTGGGIIRALDDISFDIRRGTLTALVGPDGAGKTTLLRLFAGLLRPDSGAALVDGIDAARDPAAVQAKISYMPQAFGLYGHLTVRENLQLYADLQSVDRATWPQRYAELLDATALAPFADRQAGQLSGGMKQKLGLACTLVRVPTLLLLDEPTVGVDPLSRRELWSIINHFVEADHLSVLIATSYLEEATRCNHAAILYGGRLLHQGTPKELTQIARDMTFLATPPAGEAPRLLQSRLLASAGILDAVPEGGLVRFLRDRQATHPACLDQIDVRAVPPDFGDAFMVALHESGARNQPVPIHSGAALSRQAETVIEVRDLSRRFGSFIAVDHVSFSVRRGEIFGLLGPNGAGKTTTFRMLCGLLPASGGSLRVAGEDLRVARAQARARIGYVAQSFSLYGQLSVSENLSFYASAYGLRGQRKRQRIRTIMAEFGLEPMRDSLSGTLPGGFDKRLAMACALLHEPDILFLDEPTSGADPMTRREFWSRITALAARGVTIIVTTHFMEEAEFCDRVLIQDAGRMLAIGTPSELRMRVPEKPHGELVTMEEVFIAIVDEARNATRPAA